MKSVNKLLGILSLLFALIFCLQPLCAHAEGGDGGEAGEITAYSEEANEPEEEIIEEEPEEEQTAAEEVVEESSEASFEANYGALDEEEPGDEGEEVIESDVVAQAVTSRDPEAEADNDALFQGYFENLLMPKPKLCSEVGPSNLSDGDLIVYNFLKEKIRTAAQQGGSTVFIMDIMDLDPKTKWTKEELGGIAIRDEDGQTTDEAKRAVLAQIVADLDLERVMTALMQDMPYQMYWYDKTVGTEWVPGADRFGVPKDGSYIRLVRGIITYRLAVALDYSDDGALYTVDPIQVNRAHTAVENARAIVDAYAEYGDYDKLRAYKDKICEMTDYNYAVVPPSAASYGDPWQVVYVFDGDEETKVVCEGYSKAFEYLCDMSVFASPNIACIAVDGVMDDKGAHMWNIVTLANGNNVLADVTNSDTGKIGQRGQLFLAGYTEGSVASGYGIACGSAIVHFVYDGDMHDLMTEWQLTIIPAVCTVDFVTEHGEKPDSQEVPLWSKAERPKDPVCDGYVFQGWYDGNELYDFDSPVLGNVTLTAKWEQAATAVGTSLRAEGEIGVNMFIGIPDALMVGGIYATVQCGDTVDRVEGEDFVSTTSGYRFSVTLPAAEDRTEIRVTLYNAKNEVIPMTGSETLVKDNSYVDSIYGYLKRAEASTDPRLESLKPFAKAMRSYCEYARENFKVDPDILPYDVEGVSLDPGRVVDFKPNVPATLPEGIAYRGLSLVLESDTSLKIYFTLASSASIGDYSFLFDGESREPIQLGGNTCYLLAPNIPAAELGVSHTVSVNGVAITKISALSYANVVLNSETGGAVTEVLKQTVSALYDYNLAAKQFFNKA